MLLAAAGKIENTFNKNNNTDTQASGSNCTIDFNMASLTNNPYSGLTTQVHTALDDLNADETHYVPQVRPKSCLASKADY